MLAYLHKVDSEEGCMALFPDVLCFRPVVPRMTSWRPDLFQLNEYLVVNLHVSLTKMTLLPSIKKQANLTYLHVKVDALVSVWWNTSRGTEATENNGCHVQKQEHEYLDGNK